MEEATNCEAARSWKYCGPQWDNAESDRFTSVMSTIPNKAAVIGNGDKGLSVGGRGRVEKGEIWEVKLQANKDSKAGRWELAICEARGESLRAFTDGSMNEILKQRSQLYGAQDKLAGRGLWS